MRPARLRARLLRRYHRLVLPFSAATRTANLARMAQDRFDVLVIGGGITGVGIALDAAARGFSVALIEQDDFASGTSGRSSRLVHGGLRYLEHREFGLVRESLRERGILFRLAPHLIRPVPMYMLAERPAQPGQVRARADRLRRAGRGPEHGLPSLGARGGGAAGHPGLVRAGVRVGVWVWVWVWVRRLAVFRGPDRRRQAGR